MKKFNAFTDYLTEEQLRSQMKKRLRRDVRINNTIEIYTTIHEIKNVVGKYYEKKA